MKFAIPFFVYNRMSDCFHCKAVFDILACRCVSFHFIVLYLCQKDFFVL